MKMLIAAASIAALLSATAGAAFAEPQSGKQGRPMVNTAAQATYDTFYLSSGFTPDPYTVYVTSGGVINASEVASGCSGTIAIAPDAQLTYDAGSLPLMIATESSGDTTLVVNGPDGQWYCDDDSGDGTNALLNFGSPMSGVYDIYVGAYAGNTASATLYISEIGRTSSSANYNTNNNSYSVVDTTLPANFGAVTLYSGFTPDPRTVSLRAGGDIDAQQVSSGCRGYITRAPDYELSYTAGSLPLILSVSANSDTTLVVNGPDGSWYCDDDSGVNGLNPSLRWNNPMSGTYDIWVGTYSSGNSQPARLSISEVSSE